MVGGDGWLDCFKSTLAGLPGLLRESTQASWHPSDCFGVGGRELAINQFTIRLLCGSDHADWHGRRDLCDGHGEQARCRFVVFFCCEDDEMLLQ